jgi:hypothetical protein
MLDFDFRHTGRNMPKDEPTVDKGELAGLNEDSKSESKDIVKKYVGTELIMKVQEYFFGNDELAKEFEGFVKKRAHMIDLSTDEYKLEYTKMFDDYKTLFEDRLEGYMARSLGITPEDFYEALLKDTKENSGGNGAMFGEIMGAIAGFDVFMIMMREAAEAIADGSEKATVGDDRAVAPSECK